MAGASLATANALLKEIYEKDVRKQLDDDCVAIKRLEKTSKGTGQNVGGRYVVFPIHTKRNQGIGARKERELLPEPGHQGTEAAQVALTHLYGGIELTGQAFELADKDYQSFVSVLDFEVQRLAEDLKKDLNRQVYGNGTGVISSATGANTTTTIPVASTQYFQEGMVLDHLSSAGAVKNAKVIVSAVNVGAGTIVLEAAPTTAVASGDIFTRHGSYQREWLGYNAIIGDTNKIYNIDPATVNVWKSTVDNNGGVETAVSEGMFDEFTDAIRAKGAGLPTVILTTPGVRRKYAALLQQQRQFVNTNSFEGGYKDIGYVTDAGSIPIIADNDAPKGTAFFVNEKHVKIYRHNEWEWMDRDGSRWARIPGYDAYEARMFQYSQLGTDRRNAHGKITNIAE